jgi:lipopolysaccharide export system protein LptA
VTRAVRLALALAGAATLADAAAAAAQIPGGRCSLTFINTPTTRLRSVQTGTGRYNSYVGGGVLARCDGQDVTLKSDSAEYYEDANTLYLIGAVRYREPRAVLEARRLTYYVNDERLFADGDVVVTLPSGTRMTGPLMDYYREVPGVRPLARLNAPRRSRSRLVQRDSTKPREAAPDTVRVDADRTVSIGDSLVYLGGNVVIDREDLHATADSAFLDSGTGYGQLVRRARVDGRGARAFGLTSAIIDLFSKGRELERVVAKREARAVSEDLDLRADTIVLDVDSARIARARAWGASRAVAVSPARKVVADSLDVVMPRQRLREVHALGGALAETSVDTTKLRSEERDWLRGDTLLAYFDSTAAGDSARAALRLMVATGNASSFYQVPSRAGAAAPPSLNYVRGRVITVSLDSGAVERVTVVDQAIGVYLEPDSSLKAVRPRGDTAVPPADPSAPSVPPPPGTPPTTPNGGDKGAVAAPPRPRGRS